MAIPAELGQAWRTWGSKFGGAAGTGWSGQDASQGDYERYLQDPSRQGFEAGDYGSYKQSYDAARAGSTQDPAAVAAQNARNQSAVTSNYTRANGQMDQIPPSLTGLSAAAAAPMAKGMSTPPGGAMTGGPDYAPAPVAPLALGQTPPVTPAPTAASPIPVQATPPGQMNPAQAVPAKTFRTKTSLSGLRRAARPR